MSRATWPILLGFQMAGTLPPYHSYIYISHISHIYDLSVLSVCHGWNLLFGLGLFFAIYLLRFYLFDRYFSESALDWVLILGMTKKWLASDKSVPVSEFVLD